MKNSTKNAIILLLILCLSIFVVISFFFSQQNNLVKNELNDTKKEIELNNKNFIRKTKELIEISRKIQAKNDSLLGKSTSTYRTIDGIKIGNKPIALDELVSLANRNINENIILKNRLYKDSVTLRNYQNILKRLEERKVINYKVNDKMEGEYSFVNMKYYEKKDSLLNIKNTEITNYKNELIGKNSALNLIKKHYGIDAKIDIGDEKINTKLINTEKIDSALWIYPYYKHKIKTNKKGETIIK